MYFHQKNLNEVRQDNSHFRSRGESLGRGRKSLLASFVLFLVVVFGCLFLFFGVAVVALRLAFRALGALPRPRRILGPKAN